MAHPYKVIERLSLVLSAQLLRWVSLSTHVVHQLFEDKYWIMLG